MRAAVERHVAAGSDVQAKLTASREGAGAMPIRTIRCPSCGFHLLNVYGQDHYFLQVKNGRFIRMALILKLLKEAENEH